MSGIDTEVGNIIIRHTDKWRGKCYLKEDLTFTGNRAEAIRCYILKTGDTTILNGDRITINSGNRTIIIDNNGKLRFSDRDQLFNNVNSFIITNGTDHTDPISYEATLFFISDKDRKTALKYEWAVDGNNNILCNSNNDRDSNIKPGNYANLINAEYSNHDNINGFQFVLERAEGPITNLNQQIKSGPQDDGSKIQYQKNSSELFDGRNGVILIILLVIILILCMIVTK